MIGEKLQELRKRKGITQIEMSKILNTQQASYSKWELNKRTPDYETIIKIADYFNVTVDYILGHKTKEEPLIKLNNILSEEQKKKLIIICKEFFPEEYKKIDQ